MEVELWRLFQWLLLVITEWFFGSWHLFGFVNLHFGCELLYSGGEHQEKRKKERNLHPWNRNSAIYLSRACPWEKSLSFHFYYVSWINNWFVFQNSCDCGPLTLFPASCFFDHFIHFKYCACFYMNVYYR